MSVNYVRVGNDYVPAYMLGPPDEICRQLEHLPQSFGEWWGSRYDHHYYKCQRCGNYLTDEVAQADKARRKARETNAK